MPQLDGLRAVAILAVLWSHWMFGSTIAIPGSGEPPLKVTYQLGLPWGHFGVHLFFVLSGYLITGILLRIRPPSGTGMGRVFRDFYVRRALRIFPAYYVLLAILCAIGFEESRARVIWHATYLTGIYTAITHRIDYASHFWSLAAEEQFYLLWPGVVLLCRWRNAVIGAIAMIGIGPLFRLAMQRLVPEWESTLMMPASADSLGAGALLALLAGDPRWATVYRRVRIYGALPVFIGLQTLAASRWLGLEWEVLRGTAMSLVFAEVVDRAARGFSGPLGRLLSLPEVVGIGKISYGIYLYHNFTPPLLIWLLGWCGMSYVEYHLLHPLWRFQLLSLLTLALAGVSWVCLERPFLKLKRFFPQEPPPLSGP